MIESSIDWLIDGLFAWCHLGIEIWLVVVCWFQSAESRQQPPSVATSIRVPHPAASASTAVSAAALLEAAFRDSSSAELDLDVLNAMNEDFNFDDPQNVLDDNFVVQAKGSVNDHKCLFSLIDWLIKEFRRVFFLPQVFSMKTLMRNSLVWKTTTSWRRIMSIRRRVCTRVGWWKPGLSIKRRRMSTQRPRRIMPVIEIQQRLWSNSGWNRVRM